MNIFETKKEIPWLHYTFNNLLPEDIINYLKNIPVEEFNNGIGTAENIKSNQLAEDDLGIYKRDGIERDKNFGDTSVHNITDSKIINLFTNKNIITKIKNELNIDLHNKEIKAELFEIKNLYEPELHVDNSKKIITILVYINTDVIKEAGTWLYDKYKNLHSKLDCISNSGITFVNAPNTWHRVPVMEKGKEFKRRSLLITYRDIPKLNYRDLIKFKKNIFIVN